MKEQIKKLRKSLNLSQEDFAKKLGLTRAAICNYENGTRVVSESVLKLICREYRVNYFWLTEGTGDMFIGVPETLIDEVVAEYDLDEDDKSIILNYLKLSKENREILKSFLRNALKKEPN